MRGPRRRKPAPPPRDVSSVYRLPGSGDVICDVICDLDARRRGPTGRWMSAILAKHIAPAVSPSRTVGVAVSLAVRHGQVTASAASRAARPKAREAAAPPNPARPRARRQRACGAWRAARCPPRRAAPARCSGEMVGRCGEIRGDDTVGRCREIQGDVGLGGQHLRGVWGDGGEIRGDTGR